MRDVGHAAGVVAGRRARRRSRTTTSARCARRAARGCAAHREDVEIAVAAVEEGYRLHYVGALARCASRTPTSRLLAGDRMYALGLARLAAIGDLVAIAELADVISARRRTPRATRAAEAAWTPEPRSPRTGRVDTDAKARARAGDLGGPARCAQRSHDDA